MYVEQTELNLLLATILMSLAGGVIFLVVGLFTKEHVIEWRLDPPEGMHEFDGTAEPTEEELAEVDRQKRAEILFHAVKYNGGKCTTHRNGLFDIIDERWNQPLKQWPKYKHWHIGFHWLRDAISQMEWDNSGQPVVVSEGNTAGLAAGYYVLVAPVHGGRGEHNYRRLVPVSELVKLWREAHGGVTVPQSVVTEKGEAEEEAEAGADEEEELPEGKRETVLF